MEITFKLFATLGDYLPPEAKFNQIALQVKENTTVQAVIDPFNLPPKLVHLVLLNGQYVNPEDRATKVLKEGDVLAVWPPIAGG
ncbi:MAG: MoaD/ThiS family protein [Serpentinimonas sp.]|jgi:sulfur carrier protein ThiS|nr:MoaD/ThiS family protein [Serpentinimonas sp.]